MKIAMFRYTSSALRDLVVVREDKDEQHLVLDAIRTSEYIEVDFPPRKPEEMVPAMVAAIDKEIEHEVTRSTRALNDLKARKAELLAVTMQTEPA